MKRLTCEMCGSTELVKQEGVFLCQACGTKYSVEEAKRMMVEGTVDIQGTVKVDTSGELENLYQLARRAKEMDNNENAAKYYDMILIKEPESWEANFFAVYFVAKQCKIAEISSTATKVKNSLDSTFRLIKKMYLTEMTELMLLKKSVQTLLTFQKCCQKLLKITIMIYQKV